MKSARSINTTNLDVSICKQCPRGIQLIIRKFPTSQQIKAASNRSQLDTVVSQSFSSFGDPIQFPIRTTQCRECEFHCLNHECWSWDRRVLACPCPYKPHPVNTRSWFYWTGAGGDACGPRTEKF